MIKTRFFTFASVLAFTQVMGQTNNYDNTIKISLSDTQREIIEKAAHVVPTPNQLSALRDEFIAFVHFGPNTFTGKEWGDGMEDPKIFDLKHVDTDQWCEAMKAAGMKMVILTVKHHDGFVLWQSRYTNHGIMSTGFQEGNGDILRDLSASCQKYGLKLGVYLSPADLFQIESRDGLYGNLSKHTKRTIPRQVEGRPFANKTTFEFVVDDYNEYFLNQLFEILTEYGPVHEVWFDGAHPKTKGGQKYNYAAWKKLIAELAPKAVIFGKEDIRWCGNESGATRSTEWNVIPYQENPDTMSYFPDLTPMDLGSREKLKGAKYLHYQQAEINTSIREGWFYRDDTHQKVRSADDIFDIYERSVGGNSTFLLNIPPNKEGKFSARDVAALKETGKRIRNTYGVDLLNKAQGIKELTGVNDVAFVKVPTSGLVIEVPSAITLNRIVLQEPISKHGERIEQHVLDAWIEGEWKEIAKSTNIGYKRILRFADVTTSKLRLRVLSSRLDPMISTFSAHYYEARPPQLMISQDVQGEVTIAPKPQDFGWKAHGEDIAKNLNAGYKIYYTLDGSEPTSTSTEYAQPFIVDRGEVKAVAFLNGELGAICEQRIGYKKDNWKLISVSSEDGGRLANQAFDADATTYWSSKPSSENPSIVIDLGHKKRIKGFAYTPQKESSKGMMAEGVIYVSDNGKKWKEIDRFEFGNLINDPEKRYHFFKSEIKAKYVKLLATEIAANGDFVSIAEIDLF